MTGSTNMLPWCISRQRYMQQHQLESICLTWLWYPQLSASTQHHQHNRAQYEWLICTSDAPMHFGSFSDLIHMLLVTRYDSIALRALKLSVMALNQGRWVQSWYIVSNQVINDVWSIGSWSVLCVCYGPPFHTDFKHRLHINRSHYWTSTASSRLLFTSLYLIFYFCFILPISHIKSRT